MVRKQQQAFTLIELLIVLTIISFIMIIATYLPPNHLAESYELKTFQDQLKSQLYQAQDRSIIYQEPIYVQFQLGQPIKFVSARSNKIYRSLAPPKNWEVTNNFSFYYYPNGRTQAFKTIIFTHVSGQQMLLVFQLGSGQFEFKV
ncbi:competence type IV pilus minor pilin ComGD [Facklamia lactis]|nr:competence type IV pilus minor pilin ComGD [Facklamia lactis]